LKGDSQEAASTVSNCSRIAILLVDEDPIFRQALADNLRFDGHEVVECPTAADALPAIQSEPCSALVTEYVVPGANGVYLADRFRALQSGPTVVVTAPSTATVEAHVEVRHYVRLLHKPIEYERLHDLLHQLIDAAETS
jgi:DNA-binding NtrC family response regulator